MDGRREGTQYNGAEEMIEDTVAEDDNGGRIQGGKRRGRKGKKIWQRNEEEEYGEGMRKERNAFQEEKGEEDEEEKTYGTKEEEEIGEEGGMEQKI